MHFNPHIATTGALVLALGAAAPAVARTSTGSSWVVSPNPDQQVVSSQPSSSSSDPTASPEARSNPDQQASAAASSTPHSQVTSPPAVVRVTAPSGGFDWGDAGIGAAGGIGLSMLALGGGLAVSQHRNRRTHTITAPTS